MDKIKKTITVYVPGNLCNIRCSYCYVTECLRDGHDNKPFFYYDVEHMIKAFVPKRIGGLAHIVVIGGGETLIPNEVVPFVHGLLDMGHLVEVVTNNTLSKRIDELLNTNQDNLRRLIVKCSLHWDELKRLNLLDEYFSNMRKIVSAGASTYPFLVCSNDYMNQFDDICNKCMDEIGIMPQCTPCVTAETRDDILRGGEFVTNPPCTSEYVDRVYEKTKSKLFLQTVRFLGIDPKKVFCYMGIMGFGVGMGTGEVVKCHNIPTGMNFYENIEEEFSCDPVGCECGIATCGLQYNMYGLGAIPEVENVPTYTEMVCNSKTFTKEAQYMLDTKLSDAYKLFSESEKSQYLMERIVEKDKKCDNLLNLTIQQNKYIEQLKQNCCDSQIVGVEDLLDIIDADDFSEEKMSPFTYNTLLELLNMCVSIGKRESFEALLKVIYKGMFQWNASKQVEVCYANNSAECKKNILNFSITTYVATNEMVKDMNRALKEKDADSFAHLIGEQIYIFEK